MSRNYKKKGDASLLIPLCYHGWRQFNLYY